MGYQKALEAAGAVVHEFEEFGSYQGDWFAKVTWEGQTGWIQGSYGSCSGCDAFQGEFGWSAEEDEDYQQKLVEFGKGYLDGMMTQEQAEAHAASCSCWSMEDEEALRWLKRHSL